MKTNFTEEDIKVIRQIVRQEIRRMIWRLSESLSEQEIKDFEDYENENK